MLETTFYAFVAFLVILDPPGTAAVFAAMTRNLTPAHRRQMAQRATLLAAMVLFAFAVGGKALLGALGIGLPAFRIGGGILLFLLAADMVFARQSGLRSTTASENEEAAARQDITVFPLAFPLIAGPGAMTSVVLMMGRAEGHPWSAVAVLAVLGLVLLLLLAALPVQFILDGLLQALPGLGPR